MFINGIFSALDEVEEAERRLNGAKVASVLYYGEKEETERRKQIARCLEAATDQTMELRDLLEAEIETMEGDNG